MGNRDGKSWLRRGLKRDAENSRRLGLGDEPSKGSDC